MKEAKIRAFSLACMYIGNKNTLFTSVTGDALREN